jgi:hypothetical protein
MSISRRIGRGKPRSPSSFCVPMTIALGFASAIVPTLAFADVQVRGNPSAVSVVAQNASIEEILINLSGAFDVKLRSSANLQKQLTGSYRGSLQQVLTRILDGYDFILKSEKGGAVITVLGSGKAVDVLGASPASGSGKRRADAAAESAALTGPMPTTTVGEGPRPGPSASAGPMPMITVGEGPRLVASATADPMPITMPGEGPLPGPLASMGPMPITVPGEGPRPGPSASAGPMPSTAVGEGPNPGASGSALPMPTTTFGEGPHPGSSASAGPMPSITGGEGPLSKP